MSFMKASDAISGKQAKCFVTIDGNVHEIFYARTGTCTIEKVKADVPSLGRTNVGKKSTGWNGTGTLTIYYVTSLFRELMIRYIKTGQDFNFDMQIVNEDPQSSAGRQAIAVKNCNLDSLVLAQFDATTEDVLEEELAFSFDDADLLEQFTQIS